MYNLPEIQIKELANEGKELEGTLGEQIRSTLEEVKGKMIEEIELEIKKKKRKADDFDPDKLEPRYPNELLGQLYAWKLGTNNCKNRGYILDAYPRSFEDAKGIFVGN